MSMEEILKKNEIEIKFKRIFGENLFYILLSKFRGTEKEFYGMLNDSIARYSIKRNERLKKEKIKIIKLKKVLKTIKKLKTRRKKNGTSKKRI